MTLDQMISRIDQFGESLNDLQPEIEAIRDEIVSDLRGNAPRKSGKLISSIRGEATSNSLTLYMNDYGFFQNYGVNPAPGGTMVGAIAPPTFGISVKPRGGNEFYSFQKRMFGLEPNRGNSQYQGPDGGWFSIEQIKEEFAQELGEEIIARTF